MKKIISLFMLVLMTMVFASCSGEVTPGQKEVALYFSNSESSSLVVETGYIDEASFSDTITLAHALMDKLLEGPKNIENIAVIPDGIYVRGVSLSDEEEGTVNVDLGGKYYSDSFGKTSHELLARYSIICTLCQVENIKRVKIYINGKDLKSNSGNGDVMSSMGSESVLINSPSSVETKTEKFVTLYFTDKDSKLLYPETRKATMKDNSLEKTVVTELLRGPASNKLERTVSDSAELISVETTEEVCFVNFSSGFMKSGADNSNELRTAVYSVVNSLTRLSGIDKVQILIDGKKPETDTMQLFSAPLERDDTIVSDIHN